MKKYKEILDNTPLNNVLEKIIKGEPNSDGVKDKWRIEITPQKFINITANEKKWYDWHSQKGGTGAISLVQHYFELKNKPKNEKTVENALEFLYQLHPKLILKDELDSNLKENESIPAKKIKL